LGHTAGLDDLEERTIYCLCRDPNSVLQLILTKYAGKYLAFRKRNWCNGTDIIVVLHEFVGPTGQPGFL
jgi:hypothetical protein